MGETPAQPVDSRPTLLVIGPLPPPAFGVAKATKLMLESSVLAERLRVIHLDTSDNRGVANIGRFDWRNTWLALKHVGQLARLLAKEKPGITLLTASQGTLGLLRDALLVLMSRSFHSRVVAYLRGSGYADIRATRGWLAARVLRSLLKRSALVIVLGESLVAMAHSVQPEARVAVVPNGCPPAVSAERVGMRRDGPPVVAYIGLLSRAKGLEEILESAATVATSVPAVEFVLAGGWETAAYEAHVRGRAKEPGLAGKVRFPGPVGIAEKAALLARASVLVLPSHSEGQPWVILEAMSAGVPVVATDTGAIPETIVDGVGGFVIPIGDTLALAARVTELLRDDDLWTRMSQAALQRYQERFTVERSHSALADELCRVARGE